MNNNKRIKNKKKVRKYYKDLDLTRIPDDKEERKTQLVKQVNSVILSQEQLDRIRAAVGELTGSYAEVRDQAAAIERAFREELARRLQQHFVTFVASLPCGSLEEKQDLAKIVNYETTRLGLAVRVPKTRECGFLGADTAGNPNVGEFYFGIRRGSRNTKSRCGEEFPDLELMAYDGSRDMKVDWYERAAESRRPHERNR